MSREQDVLDAIRAHWSTHGFAPTVRELSTALGLASTNATRHWLRKLEARGAISRSPAKSRTIQLTEKAS